MTEREQALLTQAIEMHETEANIHNANVDTYSLTHFTIDTSAELRVIRELASYHRGAQEALEALDTALNYGVGVIDG